MDRKEQVALMESAKERMRQRTKQLLNAPDVKATLRSNHEAMQAMKAVLKKATPGT